MSSMIANTKHPHLEKGHSEHRLQVTDDTEQCEFPSSVPLKGITETTALQARSMF